MSSRASSSSNNQTSANGANDVVYCNHGYTAIVQTVKKLIENHGRRFWCCPLWKANDCQFFEWVDKEKYNPRAIEIILGLAHEKEALEKALLDMKSNSLTVAREKEEIERQMVDMKRKVMAMEGSTSTRKTVMELKKELKSVKEENKKLSKVAKTSNNKKLVVVLLVVSWIYFLMY